VLYLHRMSCVETLLDLPSGRENASKFYAIVNMLGEGRVASATPPQPLCSGKGELTGIRSREYMWPGNKYWGKV
jgi:hypothetical protein